MPVAEDYRYLVERSRRFYETALVQIDRRFYDLAAFSLEQALQLFLKALLLRLGVDYPRTHSVRRLLELIHQISGRQEVGELLRRLVLELALLEDAYVTSRYVPRDFSKEEVMSLKDAVDEVMRVVGSFVA